MKLWRAFFFRTWRGTYSSSESQSGSFFSEWCTFGKVMSGWGQGVGMEFEKVQQCPMGMGTTPVIESWLHWDKIFVTETNHSLDSNCVLIFWETCLVLVNFEIATRSDERQIWHASLSHFWHWSNNELVVCVFEWITLTARAFGCWMLKEPQHTHFSSSSESRVSILGGRPVRKIS